MLLVAVFVFDDDELVRARAVKRQEAHRGEHDPHAARAFHERTFSLVVPDGGALALLDCALPDPEVLAVGAIPEGLALGVAPPVLHLARPDSAPVCSAFSIFLIVFVPSKLEVL